MVRLRDLRTEKGWTLDQMSEKLHVSVATLSRIEAKERVHQKRALDEKVFRPLVNAVNRVFETTYKLEDFEGIMIAPPRPGRPKRNASSIEEVKAVA